MPQISPISWTLILLLLLIMIITLSSSFPILSASQTLPNNNKILNNPLNW